MDDLKEGKISTICSIPKKMIVSVAQNVYICLFFGVLNCLREKHRIKSLATVCSSHLDSCRRVRGTQRLFSAKYLFGGAKIA